MAEDEQDLLAGLGVTARNTEAVERQVLQEVRARHSTEAARGHDVVRRSPGARCVPAASTERVPSLPAGPARPAATAAARGRRRGPRRGPCHSHQGRAPPAQPAPSAGHGDPGAGRGRCRCCSCAWPRCGRGPRCRRRRRRQRTRRQRQQEEAAATVSRRSGRHAGGRPGRRAAARRGGAAPARLAARARPPGRPDRRPPSRPTSSSTARCRRRSSSHGETCTARFRLLWRQRPIRRRRRSAWCAPGSCEGQGAPPCSGGSSA